MSHGLWRFVLPAVVLLAPAAAGQLGADEPPGQHADPETQVQADSSKNGWEVRVKYRGADDFATIGQVWTLDEAQELVSGVKEQTKDLEKDLQAAELLVVGADGDGKVKENEGPELPDWPQVEHRFKILVQDRSEELNSMLRALQPSYAKAQAALEESLRRRRELTEEELVALNALVEDYNGQVVAFEKKVYQGRTAPLPRFRRVKATVPLKVNDWVQAREAQFPLAQEGERVRKQEKSLAEENQQLLTDKLQILFDDDVKRKTESLPARRKAAEEAEQRLTAKKAEVAQQRNTLELAKAHHHGPQSEIEQDLIDKTAVIPPANRFTGGASAATFASQPGVKVLKTDDQGVPLPASQQPPGYPRAYEPGKALSKGEKAYVDPELRIMPELNQKPTTVTAGVYGRVASVDASQQRVEIEVDRLGRRLIYSGVQPAELRPGERVTPSTKLGGWGGPVEQPQVISIRAKSRRGWVLNPMSLIRYAAQPASGAGLSRSEPAGNSEALPVAGGTNPKTLDGKAASDSVTIEYDDAAEERDPGEVAELSRGQLDLKEAVAKRELERLQQDLEEAATKLSMAKQKQQEAEQELKKAQDFLDTIDPKAQQLKDQALEFKKRRLELLAEREKDLEPQSKEIDAEAMKLKGSKDKAAIEAYNVKADKFNKALNDWNIKMREVDQLDPTVKINALKKQRDEKQKDKVFWTSKQTTLETEASVAQKTKEEAALKVKQKQEALTAIAKEKTDLEAKAAATATPMPKPATPEAK